MDRFWPNIRQRSTFGLLLVKWRHGGTVTTHGNQRRQSNATTDADKLSLINSTGIKCTDTTTKMSGSDDDFLDNTCTVCWGDDCGSLCPNIAGEIAKYAVNKMEQNFFEDMSGADRLEAISSKLESNALYRQLCQTDCSRSISGLGGISNQDYTSWQNGGTQEEDDDDGDDDMGEDNGNGDDDAVSSNDRGEDDDMGEDDVSGADGDAANGNEIVDNISSQLAIMFTDQNENDGHDDDDIVQRIKDNHLTALEGGQFEAALTNAQQAVLVLDFIRLLCRRFRQKKMGRNKAIRKIRTALTHYTIGIEIPEGIETVFDLFVGKSQGLDKERNKLAGFGDIWAQAFDVCTSSDVTSYPLVGDSGSNQSQVNASNESGSNESGDDSDDSSDDRSDGSDIYTIVDDDDDYEEEEDYDDFLSVLLSNTARVSEEGDTEEVTEDSEDMVDVSNDGSRRRSSRKRKVNA